MSDDVYEKGDLLERANVLYARHNNIHLVYLVN